MPAFRQASNPMFLSITSTSFCPLCLRRSRSRCPCRHLQVLRLLLQARDQQVGNHLSKVVVGGVSRLVLKAYFSDCRKRRGLSGREEVEPDEHEGCCDDHRRRRHSDSQHPLFPCSSPGRFRYATAAFSGGPCSKLLLESIKFLPNLLGPLRPILRLLREHLVYEILKLRRNLRTVRRHRLRVLVHDRVQNRSLVLRAKGELPRHHLIEQNPQRPEVRAMINILSPRLFRGHVPHCPQGRTGPGELCLLGQLCETKVHDL